ncbi:MAG: DUF3427 domain-containing protein [Bacteroidetes bacterium]|nr:DUF3427 domain-containing protein [Bacteroidota bacterium]
MSDTLILGNKYSRSDLGRIFNQKGITSSREGIYSSPTFGKFLFFIDLVKEGKEKRFHFNDYFDGDIFHWDSQTTQHINSPRIQQILKKEIPILLFVRIYPKVKGQTQPFVYCGRIEYVEHDEHTSKPVHIISQSLDYDENTNNQDLIEIYN